MLLGDRSLLDDETSMMYRQNGISHIMAISGLHISIFGMTLFRLLRKRLKFCYLLSCTVSGICVFLFVLMSGMSVSAMRAMIMFFFFLGAQWSGRTYDSITALLYSAVFLLLINPLAIGQIGFLLSYGAVLSIGLILPVTETVLPGLEWLKRIPGAESVFSSARLSLSVWIGLAPLSAGLFYYISPYSVLLNLVVVPCTTFLLADGLIGAVAGVLAPSFSKVLVLPDHWILKLFSLQMHGVEKLPGHQLLTGHIPVWGLLLYYAVLVYCCVFLRRKHNSLLKKYPRGEQFKKKQKMLMQNYLPLYLIPVALLICILWNPMPKTFCVDFLDVGQGDGICIRSAGGNTVMIDGGSTSEDQVGKSRIQPFLQYHKIRRVDYWIVTHTDEDHVSGLLELLESGYPVSALVLSEASWKNELREQTDTGEDLPDHTAFAKSRMMERLVEAAKQNHTEIQTVSEGAVIRDEEIKMTCLYPKSEEAVDDKNELSQVWLLKHGDWSFLFTGDLGEAGEQVLNERGQLDDVDVLKVGHHGSNYSSTDAFLDEVKPKYCVISVGENNRYHHPGEETLKRLQDHDVTVKTTMESGQITFAERKGRFYLDQFCR